MRLVDHLGFGFVLAKPRADCFCLRENALIRSGGRSFLLSISQAHARAAAVLVNEVEPRSGGYARQRFGGRRAVLAARRSALWLPQPHPRTTAVLIKECDAGLDEYSRNSRQCFGIAAMTSAGPAG